MGPQQLDNLLLRELPQPYQNSFCSRLEEVHLPVGAVLCEAESHPRYAWFITSGLASRMISTSDGRSTEIEVCGRGGVVPCFHLLGGTAPDPSRCVVQMKARALRMPFPELQREMQQSEALRQLILHCAQRHSFILSQFAACNRLHGAEQRLARWLLTARDLTGTCDIPVSQGFLADILGSRRTTITLAAGTLRRHNVVSCRRGQIRILDGEKLKSVACECYETIRGLLQDSRR